MHHIRFGKTVSFYGAGRGGYERCVLAERFVAIKRIRFTVVILVPFQVALS
jgi:hypothetical protein